MKRVYVRVCSLLYMYVAEANIEERGSRGALLNVIVAPLKRGLFVLLSYAGMLPCARACARKRAFNDDKDVSFDSCK